VAEQGHSHGALKPDDEWALARKGVTLLAMGRYEETLAVLEQALAIEPEEDWYYYQRGLCHAAFGNLQQAEADYAAAMKQAQAKLESNPSSLSERR
jgi:tetratricopeptide (TPR) repeat protein